MTPEQQRQCEKMFAAVFPSAHELWALGTSITLWGTIDNELRRTAHALADGDQEKWDEFNSAKAIGDRIKWARAEACKKFLPPFWMEFADICQEAGEVHRVLEKILERSWDHPTGYISLCMPLPLPRWMSEFPTPHWDWDAFAFTELALRADTLRLRCVAFNTRFSKNESGTKAGRREAIQRMFKANNPFGAEFESFIKPSTAYQMKLAEDAGFFDD